MDTNLITSASIDIQNILTIFQEELDKVIVKNNKSAARRARKQLSLLAKECKSMRVLPLNEMKK